jgi:hypothetical protein
LGEQIEQARSVSGADVGADRGEIQFVGCGQLGEVPALLCPAARTLLAR